MKRPLCLSSRLQLLALVPLTLLLRADGCFVPGGFFPPFPAATETTTAKRLTVHLDAARPVQRFALPVLITPASGSGRADLSVTRSTGNFRLELADASFSNDDPGQWIDVSTGFFTSTFLQGFEEQTLHLSLGLDPFAADPGNEGAAVDADVSVIVAAPSDVDFDGQADGVVVDIGPLEPLP